MILIICAIAKNENAYLYEWAEYHLSIGFTHIYIYDNNDVDGENIVDVFKDTSIMDNISIIDVRGQKYIQKWVYNDCYRTMVFDWCAFIDIDEFIILEKHSNIAEFLGAFTFQDAIHLNWKCYGDAGHVKYESKKVQERFNKPWKKDVCYGYINIPENSHIKSIIRSGLDIDWEQTKQGWSSNPHTPYGLQSVCNALHKSVENSPFAPICHQVAYINHYTTKTIEEYSIKVSRQCADCESISYTFPKFFRNNFPTLRKLIWIKYTYNHVDVLSCLKEYIKFSILRPSTMHSINLVKRFIGIK